MRTRLFLTAALAILLLTATAPALEQPSFSNEVVRILQARCQACHRPGEHAPFPLLTYRDAFDKKDDIRDALNGRAMPPWKPVPGFGDFLDSLLKGEVVIDGPEHDREAKGSVGLSGSSLRRKRRQNGAAQHAPGQQA